MNDRLDLIPAALYARVSSDRQDVDLSVAAQLRALRDYAEKNGYLVCREYIDEAESGRIADRPQFQRMLDEATKPQSPFQEILVWKFSRFTRKREHAVAFKSMLAQEVVRGMREAASRGFWVGSRVPYGYRTLMVQDGAKKRPTLEPDPDTAPIVKRVFDMAEAGRGMLEITHTLNAEGIASPLGKLWGKTSVHGILLRASLRVSPPSCRLG